jgi:hypothetical protein
MTEPIKLTSWEAIPGRDGGGWWFRIFNQGGKVEMSRFFSPGTAQVYEAGAAWCEGKIND